MIKTLTYFTLIMLVGATLSAAPVEKVPLKDVRNVISQQEFLQAGLSKLSEQELRELNGALYGWKEIANVEAIAVSVKSEASGGPSSTVTAHQEQSFGKENIERAQEKSRVKDASSSKKVVSTITSQIKGEFRGWKNKTLFELANGQIWRQIDDTEFAVHVIDPVVEISKGFMGTYYLSIEGYGSRCKVKRVK